MAEQLCVRLQSGIAGCDSPALLKGFEYDSGENRRFCLGFRASLSC